ncbi:MAG TPA: LysM peptidoglycan-binding domain-containing protein, partial [Polyangiaceae bacterium]
FENPYQWPRIWSYNPQIHNPHWIYPGDEVHLRNGDRDAATATGPRPTPIPATGPGMSLVDRRRQVPHGTIFLRDQGWIRDQNDEVWGDVTGADADRMFLSDNDEVYLHIDKGHEIKMGQELTIFRPVHISPAGTIVQIGGTARIDQWNAQDRVARARIIESVNVMERGAKVGPLARAFDVVPPRRNEVDVVDAHVLASVHPNEFYGQNQVVFIDKGERDGLKLGNRLVVMRRGDAWRRTLVTNHAGDRVSADDERPMPALEPTPGSSHDEQRYPEEPVAELRVVAIKEKTATCLITQSRVEIEAYDRAVAHKGY